MAISSRNTLLAALAFIAFQAQAVNVTVAYQTSAEPAKVAQADNTFAKESGATVDWRKFDSGASIVRALASGDVQIGNLGSSPLAVAASLTRIVLALLAAVLIGIPVGIAMGLSPTVRGILDPIIELYRPVPPLAYLPLMVIWFGIGETSKILLIYLAIFAPVAMSALAGVKSAQQVRIRAAQSLGASRAQVLWFVILPGALPEILTGLRIGLGVGWSTLVAAELIAATRGLGFMVQSAGEFLATDVVLAGIAVIAIIAFLLELGLRALQRRLTPWHGEVQ
ncbi:taurine ABC transporter permease TauC [Escherichia coli]|nr:taurine ABC transporter permease TauC [Escherichia coli]